MSALHRTSRSYSVSSDAIASTFGNAAIAMVLVGIGCYFGGRIAAASGVRAMGSAVFYPPYAILLAGLLLTRPRYWWMLIAGMAMAHQVSAMEYWPATRTALADVVNASRALLAAVGLRRFARRPLFSSLEGVLAFLAVAVVAAPAAAAVMGAFFVRTYDPLPYTQAWEGWFLSSAITGLALLPPILIGLTSVRSRSTRPSFARIVEAAMLTVALIGISAFAVVAGGSSSTPPELFVAPLPLLLWAAVRFGPAGTSMSLLLVASLAIAGTLGGVGPFVGESTAINVRSLDEFLGVVSASLFILTALIRERHLTSRELRASQQRYRLATFAGGVSVWDWHYETNDLQIDTPIHTALGFAEGEIGTSIESWQSRLHPDDVDRVSALALGLRDGSTPWFETEYRLLHKDGSTRWFHTRGALVWEAGGKLRGLIGTQTDITERKRVEESLHVSEQSLRESEERTSMAANAAHLGFWQLSLDNDAMWLSDHARQLYGLAADAPVTPSSVNALKHPEDQERLRAVVQAAIDTRSPFEAEFRAVWPNGETHWLRKRGSPRLDASGSATCLTGVLVDVTERKRMALAAAEERKELAHLGRVAMVGELSSALAHELSQPLASILCNAQVGKHLLSIEPPDLPQLNEILDDIVRDEAQAAGVILQLRGLIRKTDPAFQPLRVATLASEALAIVRGELLARRVAVTSEFAPSLPTVTGDRVQLLQVLINLILNACEAMQDVPVADRRLTLRAGVDGDGRVIVSVSDHGPGIAVDRLEKVFDPFDTTKATGLGLGLAICRSIVGAHEGHLWAANGMDGGAVFYLAFPVPTMIALEPATPGSPFLEAVQ